jgi:hypothetical protein
LKAPATVRLKMISASRYMAESRNECTEGSSEITEEKLTLSFTSHHEFKNVASVVILCDDVSTLVANISHDSKSPAAQICGKVVYSELHQDDLGNLIITIKRTIPESLLLQWMKLIGEFAPTFVFSMSSSSHILSGCSEGSLRSLTTSDINPHHKNQNNASISQSAAKISSDISSALAKVELLAPGGVVTGVVATVMTFCEARSIPAASIICCKRSAITFNAIKGYESIWPVLHAVIGKSDVEGEGGGGGGREAHSPPSIQTYKAFIAKDPFARTTENLYT